MNRLRAIRRVLNYMMGFSVYGTLCLMMMPIACLLCLLPARLRVRMQGFARGLVQKGFAFVRWYCRVTRFVDMRLIDHTKGQRGQFMIANHLTMFDIVLLFGFLPDLQTLVNSKFARNPLMTATVKACGYIPLKIGNPLQGARAFELLGESLDRGEPVALFPEGTRSADGKLGRIKKGAFRLAEEKEILPSYVFFTCSQPFLNRAAFFAKKPGLVILEAHIFPPRAPEGTREEDFKRRYDEFCRSPLALAWNAVS